MNDWKSTSTRTQLLDTIVALEDECMRLRRQVKVLMNQSSTRRALEGLLRNRPYSVPELCRVLGVADRSTVYRHLPKIGATRAGKDELGRVLWVVLGDPV